MAGSAFHNAKHSAGKWFLIGVVILVIAVATGTMVPAEAGQIVLAVLSVGWDLIMAAWDIVQSAWDQWQASR